MENHDNLMEPIAPNQICSELESIISFQDVDTLDFSESNNQHPVRVFFVAQHFFHNDPERYRKENLRSQKTDEIQSSSRSTSTQSLLGKRDFNIMTSNNCDKPADTPLKLEIASEELKKQDSLEIGSSTDEKRSPRLKITNNFNFVKNANPNHLNMLSYVRNQHFETIKTSQTPKSDFVPTDSTNPISNLKKVKTTMNSTNSQFRELSKETLKNQLTSFQFKHKFLKIFKQIKIPNKIFKQKLKNKGQVIRLILKHLERPDCPLYKQIFEGIFNYQLISKESQTNFDSLSDFIFELCEKLRMDASIPFFKQLQCLNSLFSFLN